MAGIFKSSKTMENFNVVATWHEYVLAPEEERREAEGAPGSRSRRKAKRSARCPSRENKVLAKDGRSKIGAVSAGCSRCAALREDRPAVRCMLTGAAPALQRTSESFDAATSTANWRRESANTPEESKGPYFAEYDVTVPAGGRIPIGFAGTGNRRRHG